MVHSPTSRRSDPLHLKRAHEAKPSKMCTNQSHCTYLLYTSATGVACIPRFNGRYIRRRYWSSSVHSGAAVFWRWGGGVSEGLTWHGARSRVQPGPGGRDGTDEERALRRAELQRTVQHASEVPHVPGHMTADSCHAPLRSPFTLKSFIGNI